MWLWQLCGGEEGDWPGRGRRVPMEEWEGDRGIGIGEGTRIVDKKVGFDLRKG